MTNLVIVGKFVPSASGNKLMDASAVAEGADALFMRAAERQGISDLSAISLSYSPVTITQRDALPLSARRNGLTVYVVETDTVYRLAKDNTNPSDAGTWAVVNGREDQFRGGSRSVANLTARDAIATADRKDGMRVFVRALGITYILTKNNADPADAGAWSVDVVTSATGIVEANADGVPWLRVDAMRLSGAAVNRLWSDAAKSVVLAVKYAAISGSGVSATEDYYISEFDVSDPTSGDRIVVRRASDGSIVADSGTAALTKNPIGPTAVNFFGNTFGIRVEMLVDYREFAGATGQIYAVNQPLLVIGRNAGIAARKSQLARARNQGADPILTLGTATWQASGAVAPSAANAALTAKGVTQSVQIGTGTTLTYLYKIDYPAGRTAGKYGFVSQYVYSADGTHWPSGSFQILAYALASGGATVTLANVVTGYDQIDANTRRYWARFQCPTATIGRFVYGLSGVVSSTVAEAGGYSYSLSDAELTVDNVAVDDWTGYAVRDDQIASTASTAAALQAASAYAVLNYPYYNLITNPNLDPAGPSQAYLSAPLAVASPPASAVMVAHGIKQAVQTGIGGGAFYTSNDVLDASAANQYWFASMYVYSATGTAWGAPRFFSYAGSTVVDNSINFANFIQIDANNRLYWMTGQFANRTDLTKVAVGSGTAGTGSVVQAGGLQFMRSSSTVLAYANTPRDDWYGQYLRGAAIMALAIGGSGKSPKLVGKTIAWMGDSIIQSFNLPLLLAAATGATVLNFGFGGHLWGQVAGAAAGTQQFYKNMMSMTALLKAIASGTWTGTGSPTDGAAQLYALDNQQDHRAAVAAMAAQNWNAVDYLYISAGTNDFGGALPLGVNGSTNPNDFYGAIASGITAMQTAYPALRTFLGAPGWRGDATVVDSNVYTNTAGFKMSDYQKAVVDMGYTYSMPVMERQKALGINKNNASFFTVEGLHPNPAGQARYVTCEQAFLQRVT